MKRTLLLTPLFMAVMIAASMVPQGGGQAEPAPGTPCPCCDCLCNCGDQPPQCDANGPYIEECQGEVTAVQLDGTLSSDPNGGILTFEWTVDSPDGVFDDPSSEMPTLFIESADPCFREYNVQLTVTNPAFLADSCSTTVTVQDTTPPMINCPADLDFECIEDVPVCDPNVAPAQDICDELPEVECLPDTDNGGSGSRGSPLIITRTYQATDSCGNSSPCTQTITVLDDVPPMIECNAPDTIVPPDAPISFTATAMDSCVGEITVAITDFDCFKFTKRGKKIDKKESCEVEIDGAKITIRDSGGVGDHITWTVKATDAFGNETTETCEVEVVNPGKKPK